jgi:uncharacterized RDD family membrane protein YckC
MDYAGFWVRFVAYLIDFVILAIVQIPLAIVFGVSMFETTDTGVSYSATDFLSLLIGVAYFAGFEGSEKQATPGKMALGLVVTNERGGRISFARAVGRYFAKILSALILLIGFIMVAFTERKQGLHDMLAQTLVVRGEAGMVGHDIDEFA